jgi:aspartate/methionine/tyrosine aminotransferase
MGYATGPASVLEAMKTLQQFSFVCAPSPFQYALLEAMPKIDLAPYREVYRHKRDLVTQQLHPAYQLGAPEGAFYAFPQLPPGADPAAFLDAALQQKLLIVPGKAFSMRNTHFRLSYAVDDAVLQQGIEVLNGLARRFA